MERFMNNLEDISGKLQELGRKAVGEISEALEDLPETAKTEWEEAKAMWERIKPAAEARFERLTGDGESEGEEETDPIDAVQQKVDAQVSEIRAAQFQPNLISEYIAGKYGKKEENKET